MGVNSQLQFQELWMTGSFQNSRRLPQIDVPVTTGPTTFDRLVFCFEILKSLKIDKQV